MKYLLSEIVDSALSKEKTLYFSIGKEDEIIHLQSKDIAFADYNKELNKAKSYNQQMLAHFIMIYFPGNLYDNISINKNKHHLINNWVKKITERFLKLEKNIKPSLLLTDGEING